MTIQTKITEGNKCRLCGQPVEGKILVEPIKVSDQTKTTQALIGIKCHSCDTFLCANCYNKEYNKLTGFNKIKGINCPVCQKKFYAIDSKMNFLNGFVYPVDVDLNSMIQHWMSYTPPQKKPENNDLFKKLLDDLQGVYDYYKEGFLENVLIRIKQHEVLVKEHIKKRIQHGDERTGLFGQNPVSLVNELIVMGRAGANWLLQREYLPDDFLNELVNISKDKESPLVYTYWDNATLALIEIEIARKDGQFVPAIIQSYRFHHQGNDMVSRISLAIRLGTITWDERIVDCLLETLEEEFRIVDPEFKVSSVGDLFLKKMIAGPSQRAAESLIAIGNERGIAAIIPQLFQSFVEKDWYWKDDLTDWCVERSSFLASFIVQSLNHENSRVRSLAISALSKIGDSDFVGAIASLENDPDPKVQDEARRTAKKLQG
jgi:hypothetical protein